MPDVTPAEAWETLQSDPEAVLVDVRTPQEWTQIGLPDLGDRDPGLVLATWAPFFALDPSHFVEALNVADVTPDQPILLICRSGGRSGQAAAVLRSLGYAKARNVLQGFEGPLDHGGRRSSGWKHVGLPWTFPQ